MKLEVEEAGVMLSLLPSGSPAKTGLLLACRLRPSLSTAASSSDFEGLGPGESGRLDGPWFPFIFACIHIPRMTCIS